MNQPRVCSATQLPVETFDNFYINAVFGFVFLYTMYPHSLYKHFCIAESVAHVRWTEEEKEAVFKQLSSFVSQAKYPGKVDCENCIVKAKGVLHRRDWRAVKYFVKNQIDKRKRVLCPKNQ